jgi:hypothetical protein
MDPALVDEGIRLVREGASSQTLAFDGNTEGMWREAQSHYGDGPAHVRDSDPIELSALHREIMNLADLHGPEAGTREWTDGEILRWRLEGDDALFDFKDQWVRGYRDAIVAAADRFDLPPELVAGVAHIEVGGDPLWLDSAAYALRPSDKRDLTSFGDVSIQVRRASESLGYGPSRNLTSDQRTSLIGLLTNPSANIFVAAKHLSDLRDLDFRGVSASNLTGDQIQVIATRYNRGSEISISAVRANMSYGDTILRWWPRMIGLLGEQ